MAITVDFWATIIMSANKEEEISEASTIPPVILM